jgi:ribose transport system substrate-binding protein
MNKPASMLLVCAALLASLSGCGGGPHDPTEKYILITANTKHPYWLEAAAGLRKSAAALGVKADTVGPDGHDPKAEVDEFHRIVGQKPAGILVSAADPDLMKPEIDAAIGQGIPVITVDSDAPSSKRLMFVGTDNYRAGEMGGKLAAKLLQGKGSVVVFSIPEQANMKERLRGYEDAFAAHPQLKITEVVDSKGDPRVVFDKTTEMLDKKAKIDAFVCLFSVAAPEVAEVLGRHKTEKVVVAMDADPRTLEWIQKGAIAATIAQKPYTMAFAGVRLLADLRLEKLPSLDGNWAQNPFSPVPAFVDTGATLVDKSNVASFLSARDTATSK